MKNGRNFAVRHAFPCVTPYIKINRIFIASLGAPTRGAPTFNPELIELNDFFYQFTLFLIADFAF